LVIGTAITTGGLAALAVKTARSKKSVKADAERGLKGDGT
jgi:hypothetical protein